MKTKVLFIQLLILVSICAACKKIEFRNDIRGIWKYFYASGGISGRPFDAHFTILQIKSNNHYFIYSNDTLMASGDYDIFKSNPYQSYAEPFQIRFNKDFVQVYKFYFPFDEKLYVEFFSDGTFVLDEGCCDRFQLGFIKP